MFCFVLCAGPHGPALGDVQLASLMTRVHDRVIAWIVAHTPLFRNADRGLARMFVVVDAPRIYNENKASNMELALETLLFAWELAYMYNIPLEWYVRNPMWE